jgi:hypothetical protein
LPGLILSIADSTQQVKIICDSIQKASFPIIEQKSDEIGEIKAAKISRAKFLELERKFYNDPASSMDRFLSHRRVGFEYGMDKYGNPLPRPKARPYNPIELE